MLELVGEIRDKIFFTRKIYMTNDLNHLSVPLQSYVIFNSVISISCYIDSPTLLNLRKMIKHDNLNTFKTIFPGLVFQMNCNNSLQYINLDFELFYRIVQKNYYEIKNKLLIDSISETNGITIFGDIRIINPSFRVDENYLHLLDFDNKKNIRFWDIMPERLKNPYDGIVRSTFYDSMQHGPRTRFGF